MRKWIIFFSAIALAVTSQSISIADSDTEWDRTVLPRPPQPFEGVTKRTLEVSVALFTGRNHHAVGFGSICELGGGWPGYSSHWPTSAAPVGETLQLAGYNTA